MTLPFKILNVLLTSLLRRVHPQVLLIKPKTLTRIPKVGSLTLLRSPPHLVIDEGITYGTGLSEHVAPAGPIPLMRQWISLIPWPHTLPAQPLGQTKL